MSMDEATFHRQSFDFRVVLVRHLDVAVDVIELLEEGVVRAFVVQRKERLLESPHRSGVKALANHRAVRGNGAGIGDADDLVPLVEAQEVVCVLPDAGGIDELVEDGADRLFVASGEVDFLEVALCSWVHRDVT